MKRHWRPRRKDFIDLSGKQVGRFKVLRYMGRKVWPSGGGSNFWRLRCECGEIIVRTTQRTLEIKFHKGCPLLPRLESTGRHETVLKHAKDYRARQKKKGRCARCVKKAEPGKTRCTRHLKIAREDSARRKKDRKEARQK